MHIDKKELDACAEGAALQRTMKEAASIVKMLRKKHGRLGIARLNLKSTQEGLKVTSAISERCAEALVKQASIEAEEDK